MLLQVPPKEFTEFLNTFFKAVTKGLGIKVRRRKHGVCLQFGKKDILLLILKAWPSETSNMPVLLDVVAFEYRLGLILKYASWMADMAEDSN